MKRRNFITSLGAVACGAITLRSPARGRSTESMRRIGFINTQAPTDPVRMARLSALVIEPDTFFTGRSEWVAALAIRHGILAIYQFSEFAVAGGLMSYGTIRTDPYREAGVYAGRSLAGANPGDLPVQQPTKLRLVINLKTARALGLQVPQALLVRANEVVE